MIRINKTIPAYFDESLSYLEMLGILSGKVEEIKKLSDKLNSVITVDDNGNIVILGNLDVTGELSSSTTVEKATMADKLATPRKIELSGVVNGEIGFDGSQDVIIPTSIIDEIDTNAASASKLKTPRKISLQGNVTGYANFDGSNDIVITTQVTGGSTDINSTVGDFTVGTGSTGGDLTVVGDIKYRQGSNDYYVLQDGVLKVNTDGNAATATTAESASKLSTARTISLTGNGTGSVQFDGSSDVNLDLTVNYATEAGSTSTATNATNSTYSTHIGTDSAHPSIGTSSRPVYVNTAGTVTPLSATVGSATQPVYMNAGTITAGTYSFSVLTQTEYDGLTSKGANTLYFIKGE